MKDLEEVLLSAIQEDPHNARVHGDRNLQVIAESLKENEQYAPLVVQKSTMKVIVGNGRFRAMRMMGWKKAWCLVKEMSDEQAKRLALIDNRSAELAAWDDKALAAALKDLDTSVNLNQLGWSDSELSSIFDKAFPPLKGDNTGGSAGEAAAPANLPKTEKKEGGRFILVYSNDEQKEFWMTLVGIDGSQVVYTTEDVPEKTEENY